MQMMMNEDIGRYSVRSGLLQNPGIPLNLVFPKIKLFCKIEFNIPQNRGIPQNRVSPQNRGIPQNQLIAQSRDITHFLYFACIPQSAISP